MVVKAKKKLDLIIQK